jgi:hypothetical protein
MLQKQSARNCAGRLRDVRRRYQAWAGGGPALFDVETNFINGIPFATSGQGTFPASVPLSALNNNWVWGGAAQVGTTYAFAGGWFLDFAYTYARSRELQHLKSGLRTQPDRAVDDLRSCGPERPGAGHQSIRDANAEL